MTILPFATADITLDVAGGKGANLARLASAGFDVPPGFIIATDAYRAFVDANHLTGKITAALAPLSASDAGALERASETIHAGFAAGKMPEGIADSIKRAYGDLDPQSQTENPKSVAVRSSATTEDLPDLSFAGQQDTYLNIVGADEVLKAVIDCWSSLWTGRAIGYRMRNGIGHEQAALAVVVQAMVQSDVSGVLFTANPLTGLRSESVIDATLGLGEALVSGQVEPDHYVVKTSRGEIISKTLGAKRLSIRAQAGGGTQTVLTDDPARQALSDDEIRQVAALGARVQQEYRSPLDIEWAFADGKLYLLQARPITSLFPLPESSGERLELWFSFGAVQGVLGPLTPLGSDTFRCVFAGGGRMFHVRTAYNEQQVLVPAGERLWIKVSDALRHPLGNRVLRVGLGFIEPSIQQILLGLAEDPRFGAGTGHFRPNTALRMIRFALPVLGRMLRAIHNPEKARANFDRLVEHELGSVHLKPTGDQYARLAQRLDFMKTRMTEAFPVLLPRFVPLIGPSMAMLNLLTRLTTEHSGTDHGLSMLSLDVTRGLPNNVTTEMDLALWATARTIRGDAESLKSFTDSAAPDLASRYIDGTLPAAAQLAVTAFMDGYGMRGVAEIDVGQPRWRESPAPIMQTLQSYLQITDENAAPDVLFARGQKTAEEAIEKLAAQVRTQHGGWLKEKLVRFAARRVRILLGVREAPKFYAVRMIGIMREHLLASGTDFAAAGVFERPDDIFFLHISELEALSRGGGSPAPAWKALIAGPRAAYAREERRRQIPRVLVSDGRTFYEGLGADAGAGEVITGSPVSAGVVEGVVHVVLDPHDAQLARGEILVCPGTDPAWTPLFMAAGGLITEVGGMMTHGSVVAREFGIPAVVGVDQATQRLKNGQRIRLDGTAGKIVVIS